jgi:lipopolysaccharide biosynthesis glycosyltransferase
MPMAATLASVAANLDPDHRLVVTILDGGIKPANVARLQALASPTCELNWIRPRSARLDRLVRDAKTNYPPAAWFRLLLPEIIPETIDRIIYLDTDVVVEGDLAELWHTDLGGAWLGGVGCGFPVSEVKHLAPLHPDGAERGHYYNTGVLVFDLAAWRANDVLDQVLEFIHEHPEALMFADQDALNIALFDRWHTLAPRWNQTVAIRNHADGRPSLYPVDALRQAITDPAVIHFTEVEKPWLLACVHPQQDRFFHYLDQTRWAGWRPTRIAEARRLARRAMRRARKLASRSLPRWEGGPGSSGATVD